MERVQAVLSLALVAYRRIANPHHLRVGLGSVLLLLPVLLGLLLSNRVLFGEDGAGGPPAFLFGVPFLVVDLSPIGLLVVLAQRIRTRGPTPPRPTVINGPLPTGTEGGAVGLSPGSQPAAGVVAVRER